MLSLVSVRVVLFSQRLVRLNIADSNVCFVLVAVKGPTMKESVCDSRYRGGYWSRRKRHCGNIYRRDPVDL